MIAKVSASILLVEDDLSWQRNFQELLEYEGYSVLGASTRKEAELLLREHQFDLAIVDIRLDVNNPENIEGIRLAEMLETLESKLPVILTTGYKDQYKVLVKEVKERIVDLVDKGDDDVQKLLMDAVHRGIAARRAEEEGLSEVGGLLREIIGRMIREHLDLPEIGLFILVKAAQFIDAKHGNLLLVEGDELVIVATTDGVLGERLRIDKCVTGLAVIRQSTINVPNVRKEPYSSLFHPALGEDKISELAVPAMIGKEVIAVLNFESPEVGAFTEVDARQLELLAGPVAIAIDNAKMQASLIQQAEKVNKLSEISGEINSIIEKGEDQVAKTVVERMIEFMGCDKAAIFSFDEGKSRLRIVAQMGLSDEYIAGAENISTESIRATAARTRKPLVVTDILQDKRFVSITNLAKQEGFRALLEQPLTVDNQVLGTMAFYYSDVHNFLEEEQGLARTFAHHVAIAIRNAQQYRELENARKREKMATIGELSGDLVHRMNSPLAAIRANVQLTQQNCEHVLVANEYLADKLLEIHRITEEAINMVQEMKENAHRGVLGAIDLKAIMRSVLTEIKIPANIYLEDNLSERSSVPQVWASQQLAKVFRNLITNAIEAMPKGGKLSIDAYSLDDKWVDVTVEDTGIGIPEDWREEIFDLLSVFSKKANEKGHGLGLWYSRAYIEACGGEMPPPDSIVGKGAKFTFRLPRFRIVSSEM